MPDTKYTIDTSAIFDLWKHWYSPDVFQDFLDICLPELIIQKRLFSTKEVYNQIEDPDIKVWAKKNNSMFIELSPIQINNITLIQKKFTFDDYVDLTVIAQAMDIESIVINSESRSGNPMKAKIPNACEHFGVKYLLARAVHTQDNFMNIFRIESWKFKKV